MQVLTSKSVLFHGGECCRRKIITITSNLKPKMYPFVERTGMSIIASTIKAYINTFQIDCEHFKRRDICIIQG